MLGLRERWAGTRPLTACFRSGDVRASLELEDHLGRVGAGVDPGWRVRGAGVGSTPGRVGERVNAVERTTAERVI